MLSIQVMGDLIEVPVLEPDGVVTLGLKGLCVQVSGQAHLDGGIGSMEELVRVARAGDTILVDGQLLVDAVISATRVRVIPREQSCSTLFMPPRLVGGVAGVADSLVRLSCRLL